MKLVKASYEIIAPNPINGDAILHRIESAGRTCYKSTPKDMPDHAAKFVRMILDRGHESVIEHESMSVRFVVDRGVSHEIVRHRLVSYSQESTRYCDYEGGVTFVRPPWVAASLGEYMNTDGLFLTYADEQWMQAMLNAEAWYQHLSEAGWQPQQARSVLPNSLKTEIVCTANLREWRHILRLRTSHAAHPQMREVMVPLLQELHCKMPVIFDDIKAK